MRTSLRSVGLTTAALLSGMAQAGKAGAPPDRTVLPIPPTPYTNHIDVSYLDSVPQIHPLLSAPAGAPNILLILIDDAGYGQTSTFGAPIPTPTLDRLAANGLRYTRFHVAALCSPSRAALLTGRNHHSVGMGNLPSDGTGFPGYDGSIPRSAAFISETLRLNGYSTAAFGKWHLLADWERSPTGPFDHWPTSEGFEYYYGFLNGGTNQWHPALYEGTQPTVMRVPPGRQADYTLNVALADRAIAWIKEQKSTTPDRPFFVYYAPGATHSPLQAPKAWIDRFRGKFDLGWDRYREIVFERQKQLGVIPPESELTPRPPEIPAWDSLPPDKQKLAARMMEVFAGFMAQTDHEIGRVVDAIAATGQLNNTLIFYIAGDNGASLEGGMDGTFNPVTDENGVHESTAQMLAHLDDLGTASSAPLYPTGWAWAGCTPFQWGKQMASYLGGTRDPLVVHWPDRIKDKGGVRSQFHHLIDIAPTILEAAHLPEPVSVDGARQLPIEGVSMAYSFGDAAAPGRHVTQYFEMFANRGIYHDGWIAGARGGRLPWIPNVQSDFRTEPWELYDLNTDYTERRNLAAAHPGRLRELQDLFASEARKHQVFTLDPRDLERTPTSLRPSLNPNRTVFTYYAAPLSLYYSFAPAVANRSFTISAEVAVSKNGRDGVIFADGGRFGGHTLFVKDGRIHYTYNFVGKEVTVLASPDALPDGVDTIGLQLHYDGGGIGKGGTAVLTVNGRTVDEKRVPHTTPSRFSSDEPFDVGYDTLTPVGDYSSPFRFQGEIRKITFDVAPNHLSSAARAALREAGRIAAEIEE
jgi:arylsulfatase A-like enzyme